MFSSPNSLHVSGFTLSISDYFVKRLDHPIHVNWCLIYGLFKMTADLLFQRFSLPSQARLLRGSLFCFSSLTCQAFSFHCLWSGLGIYSDIKPSVISKFKTQNLCNFLFICPLNTCSRTCLFRRLFLVLVCVLCRPPFSLARGYVCKSVLLFCHCWTSKKFVIYVLYINLWPKQNTFVPYPSFLIISLFSQCCPICCCMYR